MKCVVKKRTGPDLVCDDCRLNSLRERVLSNPIHQVVLDLREGCKVTRTVTEVDPIRYGQALRQLRSDAGISLRGMAKILDLSPAFVSDCELGHRNFKLSHQISFVTACQTSHETET